MVVVPNQLPISSHNIAGSKIYVHLSVTRHLKTDLIGLLAEAFASALQLTLACA